MSQKHLFLVAGENSGDTHGAGLLRALGSSYRVTGYGGPKMRTLAPDIEDWVEAAGVVGLWEVLKLYSFFKRKLDEAHGAIMAKNPDAVVLIDYPGFNLRLAEKLRKSGYQGRILYYISPQVWAWKKGRIPRMAQTLDLIICLFPFEPQLYVSSGLHAVFAGHPLADETPAVDAQRQKNWAGLFPGSRTMEIKRLFPFMLQAAEILLENHPDWKFPVPAAGPGARKLIESLLAAATERVQAAVIVKTSASREFMRQCRAALVASGTATLESACHGLPYALVYRVSWLTYEVGMRVIKIPFLGMVNILAGREIVKELIQKQCTPYTMAAELEILMSDQQRRISVSEGLAEAVSLLGGCGAYQRAADSITTAL